MRQFFKNIKKRILRFFHQGLDAPLDQVISRRIIGFASLVTVFFLIIFFRLVYIQVFSNERYTQLTNDYTSVTQYISAPRGQIFDTNGNVLAKTTVSHNIVYTSPNNMTTDDYLLYADRIVSVFDVKADEFSSSDLKNAYIAYTSLLDTDDPHYGCRHLFSESEWNSIQNGSMTSSKQTQLLYERITDEDIDELSDKEKATYVIYSRMTTVNSSSLQNVILEDINDDDVAYLVEHKTEFPGFDVDFGGWKREYPYGETLSDVLGTVTTSTQGLPSENVDYYLQRGFQYNSPVGASGLELYYNDYLSGVSEESVVTYDSNGLAHKEVTRSAQKGLDLYLTIDIELQEKLDNTLKTVLQREGGTEGREEFNSLFTCMMDPTTGGVLAMSGYTMDLETKEMTYFASGNYVSLVNPGSCIKGATLYMGQSEGVVEPGEVINDAIMNIGGGEFGSYENHGPVNDIQALSVSSNVYMFNIAIRLGGATYEEGQPLVMEDVGQTLDKMRSYFSRFGLGNVTGVDAPGEVSGYMGFGNLPGMTLNYSIGQLDMYTPLQLLQYVSVIATSGSMYQIHLMDRITESNSQNVVEEYPVKLKSTLSNTESLSRIQQGFRACVTDENCGTQINALSQDVAGKTGTAEVGDATTANFVGYAPYENPSVAFACLAPTSAENTQNLKSNICVYNVMPEVLQTYFELYPQDQ